ncbi:MaoC/PaaZ C-terminal domain-containing protein [Bradyrhizobium iriomotense]|jgi:acyl dehydratase|uniref:MaoC/PaaZ C-terminal domain-containing protein n=1 Tax=Bradyrhizobium iriomotense TaxID=441950 RepID=UPI001B89FFFB|nr:MaoC/PaaZ C-terminal domain-containing protein [Bradyrhizobium iriomotense]MBR0781889.1 MaoC family dehydratase N-terminal domain-containing protein [Bradyrhizobium iriomotense]
MTNVETGRPSVGDCVVRKSFPPITRHLLALYCGASGDHNPIHVDIDFAKKAGFPDVFAHGMLAMAYLGQALTDGVKASLVLSFSTRFASITPVGAKLTCEGHVTEFLQHAGRECMKLALSAKDEAGDVKLAGEAIVALN